MEVDNQTERLISLRAAFESAAGVSYDGVQRAKYVNDRMCAAIAKIKKLESQLKENLDKLITCLNVAQYVCSSR
ncbi:MAG: hypothetical protein FWE97_01820 [Dehalococcoidia bacterium]|nr:hypothetical protein [Dehalococcoidia bacterium]